jgi:hypothetical protein
MKLAEEAFSELFPEKDMPNLALKYSGRFSAYNANVVKKGDALSFSLSRQWKNVDRTIQKGLIQHLLLKITRDHQRKKFIKNTINIDLYNSFIKNLHKSIPKTKTDPMLEQCFWKVNERFFFNTIEQPNLEWGGFSKRTLGSYNYQTDTITISKFFQNAPEGLLEYVMYHEMLHKKVKFKSTATKSYHHTSKFKEKEKEFPDAKKMEKAIENFLRWKRKPREFTVRNKEEREKNKKIGSQFSLKRWIFGAD